MVLFSLKKKTNKQKITVEFLQGIGTFSNLRLGFPTSLKARQANSRSPHCSMSQYLARQMPGAPAGAVLGHCWCFRSRGCAWVLFTSWLCTLLCLPIFKSWDQSWRCPQNDCTYIQRRAYSLGYRKDTHLCLTLKCATSVYICYLFSCYCSPVGGFDLISELFSWEMESSLPLFWLDEGKVAGSVPSAFTARFETPVVPAIIPPVNSIHMAPHLKGAVKGQQHVFYLGTDPSWHLLGRGMKSAAWVGSCPVKSLNCRWGEGGIYLEKKFDIFAWY